MKRALLPIAVLPGCLMFHTVDPPLKISDAASDHSACVNEVYFQTRISGLPPDVQADKDGKNLRITPDRENGNSSATLDRLTLDTINEFGAMAASRNGMEVEKGIYLQINNNLYYSGLGYSSMLLSGVTATLIPGHMTASETIDISVFENKKFAFKKRVVHEVSKWQWLPLVLFMWLGEDSDYGAKVYRAAIRDVMREIITRKAKGAGCTPLT